MSGRTVAKANPALLRWARESAGYSIGDAAAHFDMDEAAFLSWESGDEPLSIAKLRQLGAFYKRPIAIFYLPKPPVDFQPLHDFREQPKNKQLPLSPELRQAIRLAEFRQSIYRDELLPAAPPPINWLGSLTMEKHPAEVGDFVRKHLGIPIETQLAWKNEYDAIGAWIAAVESLGILVMHAEGVAVEEMRGFCLYDKRVPVIVLNSKDHPHARSFSLIHELAHLLLQAPGISGPTVPTRGPVKNRQVEVYCNAVAGNVLVPLDDMTAYISDNLRVSVIEQYHLKAMSKRYRVSPEVIARRLLEAGRVSARFYDDTRNSSGDATAKSGGFLPYYRKVVRYNGVRYTRSVLEAFYVNRINASDVSTYLNAKINQLPDIEMEAFGRASGYGKRNAS